MRNKKAWLKILEAFLGILLVMGAILVIYSDTQTEKSYDAEINQKQKEIMNIIVNNENYRTLILNDDEVTLNNDVQKIMPSNWEYIIKICLIDEICGAGTPTDTEVYTTQAIVTSTTVIAPGDPRKIRFFVWLK